MHSISRRCSKPLRSISAPDDHFTAGPDCRVKSRAAGALVVLVAVQLSVTGLYLPPVLKSLPPLNPTPDDHFAAGPHCRVTLGQSGALVVLVAVQLSVLGLYLPPVFETTIGIFHPRRSFHCRSRPPCESIGQWARWWCWWLSNYPCWDCISRRCSKSYCQPFHPRRSFHCRSTLLCDRIGQWAHWWCWWLSNYPCWDCISRRCSTHCHQIHPIRSFHCRSTLPCAMPRPEGALAVLVAVQLSVTGLYLPPVLTQRAGHSAPDDHFTAGPHCRVIVSGTGRVGRAGGCPAIRAGIVSPAGVQIAGESHPPQTIISLPVHTAVCSYRPVGALMVLVAVQFHQCIRSAHPIFWEACSWHSAAIALAPGLGSSLARVASTASSRACNLSSKRSASAGLARHSAMTKGSFPSASKSSRNTSGCLVCCAMRSISACNCSAVIGRCQ